MLERTLRKEGTALKRMKAFKKGDNNLKVTRRLGLVDKRGVPGESFVQRPWSSTEKENNSAQEE